MMIRKIHSCPVPTCNHSVPSEYMLCPKHSEEACNVARGVK